MSYAMPLDDITLISISLSLIAIIGVVVAILVVWNRKLPPEMLDLERHLDAYALVKEFSERIRKVEGRVIDQTVKLQVTELRLGRLTYDMQQNLGQEGVVVGADLRQNVIQRHEIDRRNEGFQLGPQGAVQHTRKLFDGRVPKGGLDKLDIMILQLVVQRNGLVPVADIQSKVRRSREHTSRKMNLLFKRGLVERDSRVRPFLYSISEAGRVALGSIMAE